MSSSSSPSAALHLGHLRRRRLRATTAPCPLVCGIQDTLRRAGGRAHDLRLVVARRDRRARARLLARAASGGSWRCAATRPRAAERYAPRPDGYAYAADLIARPQGRGRFRDQRRLLPGGPSRGRERRGRPREPAPQGRGRRHPAGHPVLLRHRPDPALPRPAGRRRHRGRVRAGHHADPQLHPDQALLAGLRRRHPGLARAAVRRASTRARPCTA